MNYKRVFKSQSARFALLNAVKWVPDSIMIPLQYRVKLGRWPNLNNPQRYTEKLQIYKMKYRNPIMGRCVDKYEVRQYVEEKGLKDILIPLIGLFETPSEINFDFFPNSFVLKTTDGGGGKNVLVCNDKSKLDYDSTRKQLCSWMNVKDVNAGREWAYTQILSSRIIAEKKLEATDFQMGLVDYKFFCFNGKFRYMYIITERIPGRQAKFSVYDREFNKLDVYRNDELKCEYTLPKPENFEQMISIAEHLSEGLPHVRVDLYNENGNIYFGELTFYDGSGYFGFIPDEFDYELGKWFDVTNMSGGGQKLDKLLQYVVSNNFMLETA